jgi:transcriptional regulator with XRE-family HTH domain
MTKLKRSQQKRITPIARTLRYMRMSRGISMRSAAAPIGVSNSAIAQYEQGRMGVSRERALQLIAIYGYEERDLDEFLAGKPLPILSVKDECIQLLDRIDETKLRAVHAVLQSFVIQSNEVLP